MRLIIKIDSRLLNHPFEKIIQPDIFLTLLDKRLIEFELFQREIMNDSVFQVLWDFYLWIDLNENSG